MPVHPDQAVQLHDPSDVARLEPGDAEVQGLLEAVVDPLADEPVEVDGPTQQLDVALLQQGLVPAQLLHCCR